MRKAALLAKLIPETTAGHARLSFVTEGEASLHFAVQNGLPMGVMEDGEGAVIVDAGSGTIDISSYSKNDRDSQRIYSRKWRLLSVSNIWFLKFYFSNHIVPIGHFHGSVFVTINARLFLESVSCIQQIFDMLNAV